MTNIRLYTDTWTDYCPRYKGKVTITIDRFKRMPEGITNRWGFHCTQEDDCPFVTRTDEEGRTCPVYHTAPTYQII